MDTDGKFVTDELDTAASSVIGCRIRAAVQRPSIDTNPPGFWPVIGHIAFERGVGIA